MRHIGRSTAVRTSIAVIGIVAFGLLAGAVTAANTMSDTGQIDDQQAIAVDQADEATADLDTDDELGGGGDASMDHHARASAHAGSAGAELTSGPDAFTTYGQNGQITLGGNEDEPIVLPGCDGTTPKDAPKESVEWEDECFTIPVEEIEVGENDTQATWSADREDIIFPYIYTEDINADYAEISLSASDGFEGTLDMETGKMTIDGSFDILVKVRGAPFLGDADCKTEATLQMTTETGQQGNLEGERLSMDGDNGTATIVADAFTVSGFETLNGSSTVCDIAENEYNLPAEEPGENTFQYELYVEFER
jgi:hypothetical protein